jgi:hypothetical protein
LCRAREARRESRRKQGLAARPTSNERPKCRQPLHGQHTQGAADGLVPRGVAAVPRVSTFPRKMCTTGCRRPSSVGARAKDHGSTRAGARRGARAAAGTRRRAARPGKSSAPTPPSIRWGGRQKSSACTTTRRLQQMAWHPAQARRRVHATVVKCWFPWLYCGVQVAAAAVTYASCRSQRANGAAQPVGRGGGGR